MLDKTRMAKYWLLNRKWLLVVSSFRSFGIFPNNKHIFLFLGTDFQSCLGLLGNRLAPSLPQWCKSVWINSVVVWITGVAEIMIPSALGGDSWV